MKKSAASAKRNKLHKDKSDPRIEQWRKLLTLVETMYADLEKRLATKDCTYPRFRLLFILSFEGPCSAAFLSKRLHVSRSNLSTFIKRLEHDGLVETCPLSSSETRPKYILSTKGLRYAEGLFSFHFENVRNLPLFSGPEVMADLARFLRHFSTPKSN
jgi:DNA-binding MarR family transcriptional regulator